MMTWYFLITILNCSTGETENIEKCFIAHGDLDYFTAWKKCADAAKEAFDTKEKPFMWCIKSIEDITRR